MKMTKNLVKLLFALIMLTALPVRAAVVEYGNCGGGCVSGLDGISGLSVDIGFGDRSYDMFISWGQSFNSAVGAGTLDPMPLVLPSDQSGAYRAITKIDSLLRSSNYADTAQHTPIELYLPFGTIVGNFSNKYWVTLRDATSVGAVFDDRSGQGSQHLASFLYPSVIFTEVSAVPIPAAVWLFGSGLIGLLGVARRKQTV